MWQHFRRHSCFCGEGKFSLGYKKSSLWEQLRSDCSSSRRKGPPGFTQNCPTMSKPGVKKPHWTSRVNECAVIKDARGDLNVSLLGGAEHGEFAVIGPINESLVIYKNGRLNEGELLLEVENLSISGLPLYDVESVIRNCKGPVRLKTVRPGKWCNTPNSIHIFAFFCCYSIYWKIYRIFIWTQVIFCPIFNSAYLKCRINPKMNFLNRVLKYYLIPCYHYIFFSIHKSIL